MLAPLSWIKDFVDVDCTPEELEKKLFDCGFEVESIIKYGDKLDKVVACKILSIEKHPNAERLRICQVDAGLYGVLQIITNAQNVKEGDIVPVAVDGATLATGDKINKGSIRGVESFGMFCGGEELGIDDDYYDGASENCVLVFREELPLGKEIKELLALEDCVFDISVLANRPDCQSIYGISREIACALGKTVKAPDISFTERDEAGDEQIKVTVKDGELCPRYIARLVKDVKIEKSPKWMSRRLALCGINSINNIVDITNYVLLELGQPMHAFDLADVNGNEIIVRRAENGEKIVTLDEKELALTDENLLICDGRRPVALAGIMGGLNSEIKDDTKAVLFECAKFKRDNIRRSSRKLGKSSDSSKRFEKGVDEYTTELASKRSLHLIEQLGAGRVTSVKADAKAGKKQENQKVTTTFGKINGVLGIEVPADEIVSILQRLDFKVTVDGDEITAYAPPYREDVEGYPDLAEEVIRTYGYEHIKPTLLKDSSITAGGRDELQNKESKVKNLFASMGFNEVITYSFYSKKDLAALNLRDGDEEGKCIILENPISDNYEVMRKTLVPSLLSVVSTNVKRGTYGGRIFEIARTYSSELPMTDFPTESRKLCFAAFGEGENFFTLKGAVEELGETFGIKFDLSTRADKTYLHPGVSANIILDGKAIGVFGQVAYETAGSYDINGAVYVAEIDYTELEKYLDKPFKFSPLPKFPDVKRDLAFVIPSETTCGEIEEGIIQAGKGKIKSAELFDVYESEQIGLGKKSVAFTVTFVADENPLSQDDVDGLVKKVIGSLRYRFGAELR